MKCRFGYQFLLTIKTAKCKTKRTQINNSSKRLSVVKLKAALKLLLLFYASKPV